MVVVPALLPVVRNCAASPDEPGAEKACRANPEAELWMRLASDGVFELFLSLGLAGLGDLLEGSSLLWLLSVPRFLSSVMVRVVLVWGCDFERDGKLVLFIRVKIPGGFKGGEMFDRRNGRLCMVCT